MEYVLNELSLKGQYADSDSFAIEGMIPLLGVIQTLSSFGVNDILKISTFYNSKVAPDKKLHELMQGRLSAPVLAVCSLLSRMQGEPYWDLAPRQDISKRYFIQRQGEDDAIVDIDVAGTGIAEAYARKGCLISFKGGDYDNPTENVRSEDEMDYGKSPMSNLHDKDETEQFLFDSGQIDFQGYIKSRFCGKLFYDELSAKNGLNLVNRYNFREFINSFRDFEDYTWQQIITSDSFDYKEFHKNKQTRAYFTQEQWDKGIHKFRITQEIRCFGYRDGDRFHLYRIDLDHILSDKG